MKAMTVNELLSHLLRYPRDAEIYIRNEEKEAFLIPLDECRLQYTNEKSPNGSCVLVIDSKDYKNL